MSKSHNLKHLGLILDGNRRWAKQHGLPVVEGHRRGYNALKKVAKYAFKNGIDIVSVYAFSTENWSRSKEEVNHIMALTLNIFEKDFEELTKDNIKLVVLGDLNDKKIPGDIKKAINRSVEKSKNNIGGTLAVCFNYGGQLELVRAFQTILADNPKPEDITVDLISSALYNPEISPIDLIVRTSGEQRISNFMLWRAAYSEMMFIDKNWPDFDESDIDKAIEEFERRNRRFGGS